MTTTPEAGSRIAELEARIETARMDRIRARERVAELEAKLATAFKALDEIEVVTSSKNDLADRGIRWVANQIAAEALASIQERT